MREKMIAQSGFMVSIMIQYLSKIIVFNEKMVTNSLIFSICISIFLYTQNFREVFISYSMGIVVYFITLSLLIGEINGLLITNALFITWKIHVDLRYKSLNLSRSQKIYEFYFSCKLIILFIFMLYLVSGYNELQVIFIFLQQSILLVLSKSNMAKKFKKIMNNIEELRLKFPNRDFKINLADLDLGNKNLWITIVISSISQLITLFDFFFLEIVLEFIIELVMEVF